MPSRASGMSPAEAYNMAPQQFGAINQVLLNALTNKKAYEDAFRKHSWEMEKADKEAIRKEKEAKTRHGYRMEEIKAGPGARGNSIEYQTLTQAVEMAQDQGIDMQDPEGQIMFQNIYRALLAQATGGKQGSMMMASGAAPKLPEVPSPVGSFDPRRMLPGYADYGVKQGAGGSLDEATAAKLLQKAGGDKNKARAMARKLGYSF